MIPTYTQAALDRYVKHRILPGGFLMAVLTNDLFGAVAAADSENLAALPEIVKYVYKEIPGNAWGSRDQVWQYIREEFYDRVGGS